MNSKIFKRAISSKPATVSQASVPPLARGGQKILVAEDNQSVCNLIFRVLASEGFDVNIVADGEQAWEELRRNHYDLLVTDNEMPRLAGLDLITRIREAGMTLPVILASGSVSTEIKLEHPELNIAAVMSKPFNLWEFLDTVRNTLGMVATDDTATNGIYTSSFAPPPASHGRANAPLHNHVLIADDDAVVRGSLAAVLQSEGYEVDEASNGIEAVTRAIRHKPDLVLLDLNMPHADGWTAFSQLEQVKPLLPVIIITARANQYQEAVRVGVDAFMEKPLNISILVNAIKRLTTEDEHGHEDRITKRTFVTQLLGSAV
jgi:DNA-binding response OmpR family regulator